MRQGRCRRLLRPQTLSRQSDPSRHQQPQPPPQQAQLRPSSYNRLRNRLGKSKRQRSRQRRRRWGLLPQPLACQHQGALLAATTLLLRGVLPRRQKDVAKYQEH